MREAIGGERDADDRHQREQAAIGPLADLCHQSGALVAPGDEHMRTEKNHKAQDFDGKSHNACPTPKRSPIYVAAGMMASAIALSTACAGFGKCRGRCG